MKTNFLNIKTLAENYSKETAPKNSSLNDLWRAFLYLLPSLLLASISVYYTVQTEEEKAKKEFAFACNEIGQKISSSLYAHAELLRSGSALFASTGNVSRENWKAFIYASKIEKNLPGIQGIGFSLIVPKREFQTHLQTIRRQGFPNYTIHPIGDRPIYTSIIYLEPFTGRNLRAFGYDMFTEKIRRTAMELSRDSDVAALTGKVILIQETNQEIQTGSLMYVPVYRNGLPINNVAQRRLAIIGWVYSPYRMNDLMNGILGRWNTNASKEIQLKLYDDSLTNSNLIYESRVNDTKILKDSPNRILSFPTFFNGKKWVLHFGEFGGQVPYLESKVFIVVCSGILINLFLFILIITLINTKRNALKIADQLTTDLKESEFKLRGIFENSFDAIAVHVDGICIICNNATLTLFGFNTKNEIVGHPIINVIAKPEQPRILEFISNRLKGIDAPFCYVTKGVKKNGTTFDLEVSLSMFNHLNENHVLVILRDISERLIAESKIVSLATRYQTLLQMASDGIHILNEEGRLVEANNTFCTMLGYTKEEMMQLNVSDWDTQWNEEELKIKMAELMKFGSVFQTVHRRKNGTTLFVEINAHGLSLDGQNYLYASARDITERKQAELQKEQALDRLNKIASRVPGVVYQYLLRTDGSSCFPFASDAINEIYRVTPEEAKEDATKVFEVIHPDDYTAVADSIQLSASTLQPWNFEYRVKYHDGIIRWLHGNAIPQKNEDGSVLWHGFITDITKRKELENELQEYTHQLKKSNEDLENFAYVASHDLKAPLNVVNKIFELIDDGKETPTNKLEYLRMARLAVNQMNGLIKDLLEYARIGTNKEDFTFVNLNEILEYILLVLKDRITQNNATIIVHPLPVIYANKTLINELFLNLLNNALTYHINNSVEIEIGYSEEKDSYLFYVKDNGIGIREKDFEKIFIIFKRLHTQSEFNGTGIGLALCKRIVETHKGEIWVKSELGKGSTFYFTIKKQGVLS